MSDSPPLIGETLSYIVQFLRAQGFTEAERSLVAEIQGRFDETAVAPNHTSQLLNTYQPQLEVLQGLVQPTEPAPPIGVQDFVPPIGTAPPSSGAVVGLPDTRPPPIGALAYPSHLVGDATTLWGASEGFGRSSEDGVDEYLDEEDCGYVRQDIRGQDAFVAREIDATDDDGTARGAELYHQALAYEGQQLDSVYSLSSEGALSELQRVASQAWAPPEVAPVEAPASRAASGLSGSSRGHGDKVVVLSDPVHPKSGRSPAALSQPRSSSDLNLALPPNTDVVEVLEVAEIANVSPAGAAAARPGSSKSEELAAAPAAPRTPPAGVDRGSDVAPLEEATSAEGASKPDLGTLSFLDPLALLDKVSDGLFGQQSGAVSTADEASPLKTPSSSSAPPDVGLLGSAEASTPPPASGGSARQHQSLHLSTPPAGVSSEQDDSENFTFCVTPPSEPAAPSALFGTWSSLSNLRNKSNMSSAHSSGYNTDEEGASKSGNSFQRTSGPPIGASPGGQSAASTSTPPPGGSTSRSTPVVSAFSGLADPAALTTPSPTTAAASSGGSSSTTSVPTLDGLSESDGAAGEEGGNIMGYRPLDHSMSLPPMGLINIRDALRRPTSEARAVFEPEVIPEHSEIVPSLETMPEDLPLLGLQESTATALAPPQPPATTAPEMPMVQLECGTVVYEFDQSYIDRKYEILNLKVIHRRRRTGFEETKDFPIRVNDLIAGRYQVMDFLGSAAFSKAVQALDISTGMLVCLKIIKNNKDYLDQSLDEIKLLKHVNETDPHDEYGMLRLFDFFYYKEHLFLVCELLRANLYEFQKYNREQGNEPYFTLARVQKIARQVLHSLAFLHSLGLIHSDLKPENILIKSYSRCEVKVIDLGSSCYTSDQLSSYVQSRSYRAPEVILGLPYDQKIDLWSLGCIIAELLSGYVLFQNDSLATLLARLEGIMGPIPRSMLRKGRYSHRFYTRSGVVYERSQRTGRYEFLRPKRTSLARRVPEADDLCLSFMRCLLSMDPAQRPTAAQALHHPWLQHEYPYSESPLH